MKQFFMLCSVFFLLASGIARAAEPPLALSAYVRGDLLVVTVFVDAPTFVHVAISVPPGWETEQADMRGRVDRVQQTAVRITRVGSGLGIFRVFAADGRGNAARRAAYGEGQRQPAALPQGLFQRRLAVVWR